ncbi:MAG: PIN domain-containing protein [Tannerella sp.]|jgi:predicted nucleic-acid-binding protein|nr:PIN domain-containing protein [Tannerella sp.]
MVIFDTNAILRYILQDNQAMADMVEDEISKHVCLIPVEVVAEMVYVLLKVYGIKREVIANTINELSKLQNIIIANETVVLYAMQVFEISTLDFVDCLLVGYAKTEGHEIITFDKKLKNRLI